MAPKSNNQEQRYCYSLDARMLLSGIFRSQFKIIKPEHYQSDGYGIRAATVRELLLHRIYFIFVHDSSGKEMSRVCSSHGFSIRAIDAAERTMFSQ